MPSVIGPSGPPCSGADPSAFSLSVGGKGNPLRRFHFTRNRGDL